MSFCETMTNIDAIFQTLKQRTN